MSAPIWTVTADDAVLAEREPEELARELAHVLAPYGVKVELRRDLYGTGGLRGGVSALREVEIRQAVERVLTQGTGELAHMNQDPNLFRS